MNDNVAKKIVEMWNRQSDSKIDEELLQQVIATDAEHEITKFYYKNMSTIQEAVRHDKYNSDELNVKKLLKKAKMKNKGMNVCPLCFVNNSMLDGLIFFLDYNPTEVEEYLKQKGTPLCVSEEKLDEHKKHIYIDHNDAEIKKKEVTRYLDDATLIADIENVDDIKLISSRINILNAVLSKLENEGATWKREYKDASDTLQKFIEMKSKILEGDKINITGKLDIADVLTKILGNDKD